ncbi:hypothetical protein ACJJIE_00025 (plasmid) [Microbulbifer sp. TRSA001]|uniref:hypothetical protein n=1 Tax=Microbulbifer sp. TRSA001 TaxID=3243381 RepID=UPI004039AD21
MADKYKFVIEGNDKTRAMFKSIKANLGSLRGEINSTGVKLVGLAGAGGLGALVAGSVLAQREVDNLSKALNLNSQTLSEWQYAGQTVNIEADKMADIMKDVSDKIGDLAETKGGGAVDMFENLNLNIADFIDLAPDQQLLKIGEALEGVDSRSREIFFMEALAGDATLLLPLLEDNAAALHEARQEARDFGVALDAVDSAKLKAAGDAMFRVQQMGKGASNQLSIHLAPIIEEVTIQLTNATREAGGMGAIVEKVFDNGVKVAGVFADGIHGVQILFKGGETIAWGFGGAVVGALNLGVNQAYVFANTLKNTVLLPLRSALELGTKLPGVGDQAREALAFLDENLADAEPPPQLKAAFDYMVTGIEDAKGELHAIMMEELPSQVLAQKVDEILNNAEARAQQVAAEAMSTGAANDEANFNSVGGDGLTDQEREQLAAKLETLQLSWLTELEQLQVKQDQEMALLDQAYASKLIAHDEYERRLTQLESKHAKQREKINKASNKSKLQLFVSGANQVLSAAAAINEKAAAAEMAMAVFSTGISLVKNIAKASEIGYPQNIPMIAGAIGQGVEIAGMLSSLNAPSGVSGGGSTTGTSSLTSSSQGASLDGINQFASNDQAQAGVMFNLTIQGDLVGDNAQTIADQIKTLITEQDYELIENGSHQALSLAG